MDFFSANFIKQNLVFWSNRSVYSATTSALMNHWARTLATLLAISMTRLGDLLDFGQIFKAFGNNKFAQISHILRQFL